MSLVGPEATLIDALFDALGYSQNRKPLRRLAAGVPLELLQWALRSGPSTVEDFCSAWPDSCPPQRPSTSSDWQTDDYTAELESAWQMSSDPASQPILAGSDWRFSVRPGNSPLRRLGAAARIVAPGLDRLIDSWLRAVVAEPFDPARPCYPRSSSKMAIAIGPGIPILDGPCTMARRHWSAAAAPSR